MIITRDCVCNLTRHRITRLTLGVNINTQTQVRHTGPVGTNAVIGIIDCARSLFRRDRPVCRTRLTRCIHPRTTIGPTGIVGAQGIARTGTTVFIPVIVIGLECGG